MNSNRARAGAINTAALGWIIALAVLTIVFSLLAYARNDDIRVTIEGDAEAPGRTPSQSLNARNAEIAEHKTSIEELNTSIALRQKDITRLDWDLSSYGAYWNDQRGWVSSGGEEAWTTTRTVIQSRANMLAKWSDMYKSTQAQRFELLETIIRDFQDKQQEVLAKAADIEDRLQTDRDRLSDELERYAEEKRQADEQYKADWNVRATKKTQLDQQIRELLDLRMRPVTSLDADASVVQIDLDHRYLILDIGTTQNVRPGLKFEIFQYEKGNYVVKGMAEVTEVGTTIATCRLLEEVDPKHNPITKGDKAGNLVFHHGDPKIFFLAGEFYHYNKEDIAAFIRGMGGEVREELTPGVDYLVEGERLEDDTKFKAAQYNVMSIKDVDLIRQLDTTFKP